MFLNKKLMNNCVLNKHLNSTKKVKIKVSKERIRKLQYLYKKLIVYQKRKKKKRKRSYQVYVRHEMVIYLFRLLAKDHT